MASYNLFYTYGKVGGGGTSIDWRLIIAGSNLGIATLPYGAAGALSVVKMGTLVSGNGGNFGMFYGTGGILET